MMDIIQDFSPILVGTVVVALVWCVRARAARKSDAATHHLEQAAELLLVHNAAMGRFLDDPDAPSDLKRRMILFSDAMTDRKLVKAMAEWMCSRSLGQSPDTEDVRSIKDHLTAIGGRRPDLVEDFAVGILTSVVGASMRWSDSAAMIEQAFPRLLATPQRDIAVVATASIAKPALAFAMKPMAAAMA
jgi:hypothetical protein